MIDAFPIGLDFVMVFEYMPSGLWELIKDNENPLTASQTKTYMKMLLEGVAYMHSKNIMHRVGEILSLFSLIETILIENCRYNAEKNEKFIRNNKFSLQFLGFKTG